MDAIISQSVAATILLILLILLATFHLLVLVRVVPHDIIWSGKIRNSKQLVRLELISLLVLAVAIGLVLLNLGWIGLNVHPLIVTIGNWALFGFFVLNTLGNLTAKTKVEKYGFGLLTLMMAVLALAVAL